MENIIDFINSDPTLKYIWEHKIDYEMLEHQVKLKVAVSKIAFSMYLDYHYPTKTN